MRLPIATRLLASFAVVGTAASIAGLGTFATFTSSTTASGTAATGSVTVSLPAAGVSNRLTVGASAMAAGDTLQRAFVLNDTGTINLASITLTTTASPSSLLDTDAVNGLQMVIDRCSVAWTEAGPPYTYTCAGTTTNIVASRAVIGSAIALPGLSALTAGSSDNLRLTLTLPSGAGNTFQSLSSTITYSFTGTQRAATNQ